MDVLLEQAREARSKSIAPYSEFPVGAALRTADGSVYGGANMEIVNYSNSLHAEEVAFARALFDGHREFEAVAVSGPHDDGLTPCGMCRQTLAEFCGPEFEVIVDLGDDDHTYTLGELLPATMSSDDVLGG
ncbi:MAG: cytidine deaminase [Halobacteriales archaeon]|nr:cytidine deaminase [Halobacteriales archaeon]